MAEVNKRKLRVTTFVYWVLLVYIVVALFWWFFSLYTQTDDVYSLQRKYLETTLEQQPDRLQLELAEISDQRRRDKAKYIGEGATFFVLILVGAVFLYRSVRRQFRAQQQEQNFVMAITHELKTPISVARLNLETLQRHNLDEAKKVKLVQMTLQETLRLDSLINNILISSQLDGHSYRTTKEDLSFSDLVRNVVNHFASRYPDRQMNCAIDEDIDIKGDPLLLKLLVSNLLENANKYSPRNRPIQLRLHSESGIKLYVSDEGCGISDEEKKNVFAKFYRIGNEQTRTAQGTGLGLYLCKKIAEDHNGRITITDNMPQGSNFIVSFG